MKKLFRSGLLLRIVLLQLVIGIAPLLFFGLSSVFSMIGVLKDEATAFQKNNVRQGALYIDLVMDDIESLIDNLSGIDEVNNALSSDTLDTTYSKLTTQAKIGYILSGYTNLKGLISIDLFSSNGSHYHIGETLSAANINKAVLDALFSETQASEGFVNWGGIESNINLDSKYSSVITASKILYPRGSKSPENYAGLLVISYDPAVFKGIFGDTTDPSSYSVVLDKKSRIIFHPDPSNYGQVLSNTLSKQIDGKKEGFFTQKINGENMLVVFDGTQRGGFTVAEFIPLKHILSNANTMTITFVLLTLLSIAVTAVFAVMMSKQIVQPIKKVTDTFRRLKSGDFVDVSKLKYSYKDEIGELGNLFNSFIDAREDITTQKKLERQLNRQNKELQETLQTLKAAQAQIVQQEKMAGIGQLAAGVAHEINNPLGFVTSNFSILNKYISRLENMFDTIDFLRQSEHYRNDIIHKTIDEAWTKNAIDITRSDLKEIISDTQEGLSRIAEIVNALKMFSRTSLNEEKTLYNLNEGIKSTLRIASNEIKYNSTVQFTPTPLPETYANGGQINQVLLNIIVNAAQAIKQKQQSNKGVITIDTYAENGYLCSEIGDNGCGIPEDVLHRIFEPFFSTKPVGKGTGLGLSLAYDIIVNKHNGKLEVKSEYGVGTSFRILIPQAATKDEQN